MTKINNKKVKNKNKNFPQSPPSLKKTIPPSIKKVKKKNPPYIFLLEKPHPSSVKKIKKNNAPYHIKNKIIIIIKNKHIPMLFWYSFFRASFIILLVILLVLNVQYFWENKRESQVQISEKL